MACCRRIRLFLCPTILVPVLILGHAADLAQSFDMLLSFIGRAASLRVDEVPGREYRVLSDGVWPFEVDENDNGGIAPLLLSHQRLA